MIPWRGQVTPTACPYKELMSLFISLSAVSGAHGGKSFRRLDS